MYLKAFELILNQRGKQSIPSFVKKLHLWKTTVSESKDISDDSFFIVL